MATKDDVISAMMWLEYAIDPETCKIATNFEVSDCIWIAHSLLQGHLERCANYPCKDCSGLCYARAVEITKEHSLNSEFRVN